MVMQEQWYAFLDQVIPAAPGTNVIACYFDDDFPDGWICREPVIAWRFAKDKGDKGDKHIWPVPITLESASADRDYYLELPDGRIICTEDQDYANAADFQTEMVKRHRSKKAVSG